MLDVILTNPYRVLSVYSNSPKKEVVANLSKINAFLKVGKPVSFPTDMQSMLSDIVRTNEIVSDANSKLALPVDQFRYAQFWFVNTTSFDDIALNNLIAGDVDKALSIWEKREDASSLQNRIVCNLILDNVSEAISCAEKLYTSYKKDFVKAILGDNPTIDTENVEYDFLEKLCDGFGANEILPYVSNENWEYHISGQAVKPLVDGLLNAVSVAKQSKGNGPEARYNAGTKLMNDIKAPLKQLNL